MKFLTALHIILAGLSATVFAQVVDVDSTQTDTLHMAARDSVAKIGSIAPPGEETAHITPWQRTFPLAANTVTTDSLLRWQLWPGFGDFQAGRRESIAFRTGIAGRADAIHIHGYLPREQEVRMEGIDLKNPVTGMVNYNLIPHRKIARFIEQHAGSYYSEVQLNDYYILKPLSYLNYGESKYDYRNLEFMVSQNFTESTNLELSYWDRRDGGYFPNNSLTGSQIFGRAYHHLTERLQLRAIYIRNSLSRSEPFGYVVGNPEAFAFDRFTSVPASNTGSSESKRWDLVTGIYHRGSNDSRESSGLEFSLSKNFHDLSFERDTLNWEISAIEGRLFHTVDLGALNIAAELDAKSFQNVDSSSLSKDNWGIVRSQLAATLNLGGALQLYGKSRYDASNYHANGYEIGGGIKTQPLSRVSGEASVFTFSRIPSIQALFWQSRHFRGDTALKNEEGYSFYANADIRLFSDFVLGSSVRYKHSEFAAIPGADSTFINGSASQRLAFTLYGRFESTRWELESSATAQLVEHENTASYLYANEAERIVWFRSSIFYKNYVFDRAAFLKIGLKSLISPLSYYSRTFNAELQYWQEGSSYQAIPPFIRLDAEVSARVRGIMVLLRWENTLDGVAHAGYFEAAGYPMPPRRLIVGIRAQFRN